ncbi:MAG TPA: DUF2231 domain-containing protein [Xanthobacteraceae bacterium]|nr:DUF2231 domain-containing protein [Xanthobacteraceae bacterium]
MEPHYSSGSGSSASVMGHPLHPLLVTLPIGFLVGAAGSDLMYVFYNQDPFWIRASYWLIGAGLVAGAIAAVFGIWDIAALRRARTMGIGWMHAAGNVIALIITLLNFQLRTFDYEPPYGWILSVIVVGIFAITGILGGEMVYRHGIAVSPGVGDHPEEKIHQDTGKM